MIAADGGLDVRRGSCDYRSLKRDLWLRVALALAAIVAIVAHNLAIGHRTSSIAAPTTNTKTSQIDDRNFR